MAKDKKPKKSPKQIAPEDYAKIYKKGANVKRVPSDAPTAMIAPSDYAHIYSKEAKGTKSPKGVPRVASDAPTAVITPSKTPQKSLKTPPKRENTRKSPKREAVKRVPSDAPTVAPSDYEHLIGGKRAAPKSTANAAVSGVKTPPKSAEGIPPALVDEIENFVASLPKKYDSK